MSTPQSSTVGQELQDGINILYGAPVYLISVWYLISVYLISVCRLMKREKEREKEVTKSTKGLRSLSFNGK